MGFIQLNEDFIFIEPLNDTMAITGHPHRVYRQKRSMEEKVTEKSAPHSHYCGIVSGNAFSWKGFTNMQCKKNTLRFFLFPFFLSVPLSIPPCTSFILFSKCGILERLGGSVG